MARDKDAHDILEIIRAHYPEISGIHPAADLFPMMSADEFTSLVGDITVNGLATDVVLTKDGRLIDGRNRLLACYETGHEVRFRRVDPTDPIAWAWGQNGVRRHLTDGQKAMIGDMMRGIYDEEAKARQIAATVQGNKSRYEKPPVVESFPQLETATPTIGPKPMAGDMTRAAIKEGTTRNPPARDLAGAVVGITGRSLDKARDIRRFASPETVRKVETGQISLEKAHQEIAPVIKAVKAEQAPPPSKDKSETQIVTPDGEVKMIPLPAKTQFNATNGNVEWASWTWNPVTGCLHGCSFCYARAITTNTQMAANYPFGFEPAFYEYRLAAPANTRKPISDNPADGRVFVGSMADLFGKWVPDEWIEKAFAACMTAPDWEYLFLTKWPKRYSMLAALPHAWFGASVIQQSDVQRIENNMRDFETTGVKWVSLEPMLEPIRFNDLSWCDLVVIGAQTATNQPDGHVPAFAPQFDWVVDVVNQCRAAGVPYYLKPNLASGPGMVLPKSSPRRKGNVVALIHSTPPKIAMPF